MRILSVSAQKPDSTGSGVFLTELVKGFKKAGHQQAIICGFNTTIIWLSSYKMVNGKRFSVCISFAFSLIFVIDKHASCSARKGNSLLRFYAYLVRLYSPFKGFHSQFEYVFKYHRLQARRVAVDEHEQRIVHQNARARLHEVV